VAQLQHHTEQVWTFAGLTKALARFTGYMGKRRELPAFHLRRA